MPAIFLNNGVFLLRLSIIVFIRVSGLWQLLRPKEQRD